MYQPINIKLKNIGTIKELEYDFQVGQTRLFVGKNLQDQGQRNNGVGKSSFIDGIGFGIAGVSLRGLVLADLINDNEKEAEIHLLLKTIDQTRSLQIRRYLSRKSPQRIEIFLNDVPLHTNLADVDACNAAILKEIDITKEDLFQFFLLTKQRYKPYFNLSDNDKKAVANRFSKGDRVDAVFPTLETTISTQTAKANDLRHQLGRNEGTIDGYKQSIEVMRTKDSPESKEALKTELTNSIATLHQEAEELDKQIKEFNPDLYKEALADIEQQRALIQTDLETLPAQAQQIEKERQQAVQNKQKEVDAQRVELTEIETSKEIVRKEWNDVAYQVSDIKRQIQHKTTLLNEAINCPACDHSFFVVGTSTVEDVKKEIAQLQLDLADKENEANEVLELKNMLDAALASQQEIIANLQKELNAIGAQFDPSLMALTRRRSELMQNDAMWSSKYRTVQQQENQHLVGKTRLDNELSNIETKLQNMLNRYDEVDQSSMEDAIKLSEKSILELEETNRELLVELEKEEQEIIKTNEWVLKFKNFKSYLANQSLKVLEHHTNSFLQQMNTNLSVELSAYKKTGKKVVEKVTATVVRDGIDSGSYNRYSGGERGRIDVGVIMANQTLINSNATRGLDFLLIDEVLESVDALGTESIVKAMNNVNKTVILVTQLDINTIPEQTTTLIKQNGATTIE